MQTVLIKILKKIKPTVAETKKFQKVTAQVIKKIDSQFKDAKAILGGSGAKDTWLSGSHDVDIFVQFDFKKYKEESANLSTILEEKLNKLFPKVEKLHGSRDYFQLKVQNYLFEIVPILKIEKANQAINITDISPLHAKWIKKYSKKLGDDIRLSKKFCKSIGCYGAESHIGGFSGYVLEILTIHYGSFNNFLKAASMWEGKDIVDTGKYFKERKDIFKNINESKLRSPLIVVDPTDKSRNAAAALDMEKFLLFKQKASDFLQKPNTSLFEKEKITFLGLEKRTLHNTVFLEINPLSGKNDVVGSKIFKVFQFLKKNLKDFEIEEAGWDWDNKAIIYFILRKRQIDPYFIRCGPPLKMEDHVKEFKKVNKETFEDRRRIMARIPIKHFRLKDYMDKILKDNYVKERIKSVKKIQFG